MTIDRATDEAERFRQVVKAAPNAMLMVAEAGRIDVANPAAATMFGYGCDELAGRPIEVLVPERFRTSHPGLTAKFFASPSTRSMAAGSELFGRRKDGTEIPVEIGLGPVVLDDRSFVLASVMDVTERRHVQDWFRRILEAVPNAAIVVDANGFIRLVNRAAETLFDYARTDLVGQRVELLIPEQLRAEHPTHVASFYADPRARPMGAGRDLFGRRSDGTEVPIEIGLSPIDGPDGQWTVASVIDLTDRQRREDELRRSNEDLEQFAYVASHDLQEPLRMVANYTELLAQRYQGRLDDKADKYIHYACDGARRMQELVADLLAYARVGSQGRPLVPVVARDALDACLDGLRKLIRETNATIEIGPLPTVLADEVQLRLLFQNLLGNAIKFRSAEPPRVRVEARRFDDKVRFSVTDNGIGIDPRYTVRIFQMFQRLHARGVYDGSGIGLAIAQRIVERHGGRIWLEPAKDAGTTFHFTLVAGGEPTSQ